MVWYGIINQTNIFPKDLPTHTYLDFFFHFSYTLKKIEGNGNQIEKTNLPEISSTRRTKKQVNS